MPAGTWLNPIRLVDHTRLYFVPFLDMRRVVYVHKLVYVGIGKILDRIPCKHALAVGAVDFLKARRRPSPLRACFAQSVSLKPYSILLRPASLSRRLPPPCPSFLS